MKDSSVKNWLLNINQSPDTLHLAFSIMQLQHTFHHTLNIYNTSEVS